MRQVAMLTRSYILGSIYSPPTVHSSSDDENSGESFRWYSKAAAQGAPAAIEHLVYLYQSGDCDVKLNKLKACEWMETYLNSDSLTPLREIQIQSNSSFLITEYL